VKFSQALALLRQWRGVEPLLHEAALVDFSAVLAMPVRF